MTDPPYHGVKKEEWDNQWRTDAEFLSWVRDVCCLLKRPMADNASLYWFASPQMADLISAEIRKLFRVLNTITWSKGDSRGGVGGTGIDTGSLRRFWTANSERVIFAEQYGSDESADDASGYTSQCEAAKRTIIGDYLRFEFQRAGVKSKEIAALFPSASGGLTGCVHNWLLGLNFPTSNQYDAMREYLNRALDADEYLRRDYEELRRDYEEMRRPFFVTNRDEWCDVWSFKIERNQVHPTQKPLALMSHIVNVSSRKASVILDAFMGSGTCGASAIRLGRRFIGIEKDPGYFEIARARIESELAQGSLFDHAAPVATAEQESML